MSYDLFVFSAALPENLRDRWPKALAQSGLVAEIQPDADLEHPSGYLAWKIRVASADAFRYADLYPTSAMEAGFELRASPADVDLADWRTAAPDVVKRISSAEHVFAFSSANDCTPTEFRLLWFAAATLAGLTDGVLQDPQEERSFNAEDALEEAAFQADKFEEDKRDEWTASPEFVAW